MPTATHSDIIRVFPNLPDSAIARIEAMRATVTELDAALVILSSEDSDLIEDKQRAGDRLNQLLAVLSDAGIEAPDDHEP